MGWWRLELAGCVVRGRQQPAHMAHIFYKKLHMQPGVGGQAFHMQDDAGRENFGANGGAIGRARAREKRIWGRGG